MKKLLIALVLLALPAFASASIDTNLYYGIKNKPEVQELQEFLIDKGFLTGQATGNFYSLTLKAVKSYQDSVNISHTGFVGVLTRKSINDTLLANLDDSDKDSVAETGTTPPTPVAQNTTNDVVTQLQAQNTLLQQQLQATQQLQQTTQQIVQNTTIVTAPPPPPPLEKNPELIVANTSNAPLTVSKPYFHFTAQVYKCGENLLMISDRDTTKQYFHINPGATTVEGDYWPSGGAGEVHLTFTCDTGLNQNMTFTVLPN